MLHLLVQRCNGTYTTAGLGYLEVCLNCPCIIFLGQSVSVSTAESQNSSILLHYKQVSRLHQAHAHPANPKRNIVLSYTGNVLVPTYDNIKPKKSGISHQVFKTKLYNLCLGVLCHGDGLGLT